jgi:hypothetical protein
VHRVAARLILPSVLASCAALALTTSPAAASSAGAARAGTPHCTTSGLVIWLPNGNGNGAAGSIFYKLRLTNLSGHTCTLSGFPRVSAVDVKGKKLGKQASHETGQKAGVVKLAPGGSASFQLRVVEPGNFSPADCHEVTAAGLRVTPPGQTASKVVPFPFQTCSQPTQPVLTVGPVRKG